MTSNKDKYKRFITFLSALLLLGVLTGVFAYIWYEYYKDAIVLPYYRRGNWVVIAIYLVLTFLHALRECHFLLHGKPYRT